MEENEENQDLLDFKLEPLINSNTMRRLVITPRSRQQLQTSGGIRETVKEKLQFSPFKIIDKLSSFLSNIMSQVSISLLSDKEKIAEETNISFVSVFNFSLVIENIIHYFLSNRNEKLESKSLVQNFCNTFLEIDDQKFSITDFLDLFTQLKLSREEEENILHHIVILISSFKNFSEFFTLKESLENQLLSLSNQSFERNSSGVKLFLSSFSSFLRIIDIFRSSFSYFDEISNSFHSFLRDSFFSNLKSSFHSLFNDKLDPSELSISVTPLKHFLDQSLVQNLSLTGFHFFFYFKNILI